MEAPTAFQTLRLTPFHRSLHIVKRPLQKFSGRTVKRVLILHAKNVATVPVQIAKAVEHGFKRRDMESDYGAPGIYVDKRMVGQKLGYWTDTMLDQLEPGDIACILNLLIFGNTERVMRERVERVHAAKASVFLMDTSTTIKPSADLDRYFSELRAAHKAAGRLKNGAMNAGRKASGTVTSKPRFSEADREKIKGAWLRAKTQPEAVLFAEKDLGRPVSYSQMFRWARTFEWGERGSGPRPKPVKRKKRRARR
jgi:hypothetical protein